MNRKNFAGNTFRHVGALPPERHWLIIPGRSSAVELVRMTQEHEIVMRDAIAASESLLRSWLVWHDAEGDRGSWSRVAEAVAGELANSGWWEARHWFNWVVLDVASGEFLGAVDIGPKRATTFEMGYFSTTSPAARGVVKYAARAVAQFGFVVMGAEQIVLEINAANRASANVARSLGATIEQSHPTSKVTDERSDVEQVFVVRRTSFSC